MNIAIVDERYQNPGILKNFDYNTIITGSSMVENFRASWFETAEDKVIKVPYSGGYTKDFENVFNLAFENQKIKTIYFGLDILNGNFSRDSEVTRTEIPEYLYDNNLLNDVEYIFNKDIFYDFTITNIQFLIKKIEKNNDLAYNWNNNYNFSKENVLNTYTRPKLSEIKVDYNYQMQNYEANMKNITKYVERYPETKFIVFFPPYSILTWDNAMRNNMLEANIAVTERVIKDLLQYNNVELYYFTNIEEIITNLDNYKDYTHYSEDINYYMYECMCKTGEHKVTKENYMNEINKMRNLAISYDYDKIFEE